MTAPQWQFQYAAIRKYKSELRATQLQNEVLLYDRLAGDIDALSVVINPKVSKEYMEKKEEYRAKQRDKIFSIGKNSEKKEQDTADEANINNLDINNDNEIKEYMEKYYDTVPNTITIPAQVINQDKYILPKFDRTKLRGKNGRRFADITPEPTKKAHQDLSTESGIKITKKKIEGTALTKKKINITPKKIKEEGK